MKLPRHSLAAVLTKRSLQAAATADGGKLLAAEIAAYLLSERRVNELESLLRDMKQRRADQGIVEVTAVSAYPLSGAAREDITAKVRAIYPGAKEVIISNRHEPGVLAGVKLEFANQQLDLSARAKLNRLKQLTASPNATKSETTRKDT